MEDSERKKRKTKKEKTGKIGSDTIPATPFAKSRGIQLKTPPLRQPHLPRTERGDEDSGQCWCWKDWRSLSNYDGAKPQPSAV